MAVLPNEQHPPMFIQGNYADRAGELGHVALRGNPAGHRDLVGAQGQNPTLKDASGPKNLIDVHGPAQATLAMAAAGSATYSRTLATT